MIERMCQACARRERKRTREGGGRTVRDDGVEDLAAAEGMLLQVGVLGISYCSKRSGARKRGREERTVMSKVKVSTMRFEVPYCAAECLIDVSAGASASISIEKRF